MRTRLISLAVAALAAVTVLAAGQPDRPAPGGQPDKGGRAGGAGDKTTSLDGEWMVVSAARDGTAVDGSDKMTVTIKGNVVTFGVADDKSKLRALRLDFGPNGTVRVAEAGADGKFGDSTGGTGTNPGDKGGTTPPAGGKDTQPGGTGAQPGGTGAGAAGTMSGVYVCTPDFLAISVFTSGTGGTGTNPGGAGARPPAGGTGAQPGGTGTQPGGTGAGATGTGAGPQMKTHVSVILKRSGGSRP